MAGGRKPGEMSKVELYKRLHAQLKELLEGERDFIASAANFAALIYHVLPEVNWAGFYFLKDGQLVLGPFQGKAACTRIELGRGVCGTAAQRRQTVIADDVAKFPGHITCDGASRSEIVVPLIEAGELFGVLDLDSPMPARFDANDQRGLEEMVATFVQAIDRTY